MQSFFLWFALQCFFPIWDSLDFAGLSILNRTRETAAYTITVTDAGGTSSQTGRVTLRTNNQRAFLLSELSGISNLPVSGWVRIDSTDTACSAYFTGGTATLLAGTEGTGLLSRSILLPRVQVDDTGFIDVEPTETFAQFVNPSNVQVNVSLQLFSMNGTAQAGTNLTVPARGSRTVAISQTFRNALPPNDQGGVTFDGYLRAAADLPIAAWQRIRMSGAREARARQGEALINASPTRSASATARSIKRGRSNQQMPGSQALIRGRALEEIRDTRLAMIPHFAFGGPSLWNSILNVINPSNSPITLEFTAEDARGRVIGARVQRTLAPGEGLRSSVLGLFQVPIPAVFPPPFITGYVRIREVNNGPFQLAGDIEINANRESGMLHPIIDMASQEWVLPFATSAGSYFTGYAIVNPNEMLAVQTDVTVEVLHSDATSAGTTRVSLSPAAQFAAMIPEGLRGGYIRITANLPIHVLGSIGTQDLKMLSQLPAISPSDGPPPALTALPRDLTPAEHKVIDSANAFSLALWAKINAAQRTSNVFVSPLSASFSLGMTLNGAANQTFQEMRSALQFGGSTEQEINDGYQSLIALLTGLDPAVKTGIANSIWYRDGFPFTQSFLNVSKQYFDAEVRGLNFADQAASLAAINGWVDSKTNHKIPSILDNINPEDVMFLINAIYFNGNWREKFNPAETREALFHAADGTTQPMSLMHRQAKMSYLESATYQAVDLPYGNSAFTMTVVLPKEGTDVESLAASLTPSTLQSLTTGLHTEDPQYWVDVDLSLPKLRLSYERTLNDDLKALGVTSAFVPDGADFTRMSPRGKNLYISFVKQKTFIDIHEEGTEAAAVTATGIGATSVPPPPKVMRVDRPYIFVIRERLSGTLLFMGKIARMPS